MAGKIKRMSQIKQLLRLQNQGIGKKKIARILSMSKTTVNSYLEKVSLSGLSIEDLLKLEDPKLEAIFFPGNPSYKKDERYHYLKDKLDYYSNELKRKGVNKTLLWQEYKEANPLGYSHSQFCYHLQQHQIASDPSMVLKHNPGEKLYIDFAGDKLSYIDRQTGEIIPCQVFVACLPYSDYSFAMAVRTQSISDFLYALGCCLKSLGGVPQVLVPDNLKSAIIKASRYEPEVNQALEDFANHYGATVIPTRVRKPKDKALVENQVKLIYSRVYAKLRDQHFFDLSSLNNAIREKVKAHNQTRMQQKPYCREERFLSEEKKTLNPLPENDFELKYYRQYKVAPNNHIYLTQDKHYYSVPYTYIGKKVKVIYTRSMVYIYYEGKQIAVHIRSYIKGGYTTIKEHLCSQHQHYLDRSPDYYKNKAKACSADFFRLVVKIFDQDKYPEQLYKSCDGLISLYKKSDTEVFSRACQIAIENNNLSYRFILNMIENKMTDKDIQDGQQSLFPLPQHENTRGKGYYK